MMNENVKRRASEAQEYFVTDKRADGNSFIKLRSDAPQWLKDLVREAHRDMLPDDERYRFISDAFTIIAESEDEDEFMERLDSDVDVYTSDLTGWLHSRNDRVYYINEVIEEWGEVDDGFKLLAMAQYKERSEVLYDVLKGLQDRFEDEEEDEDDDSDSE
jgi:hypothetical protein